MKRRSASATPPTNAPAFGWLKSVRADGDLLFGTFEKVPPAMDHLVDQGANKNCSIAFRTLPGGKLQVRHVGYLGAMDPHIQGLADAQFADEQFQEIEFSGTGESSRVGAWALEGELDGMN